MARLTVHKDSMVAVVQHLASAASQIANTCVRQQNGNWLANI
jgi:hypothetical protein